MVVSHVIAHSLVHSTFLSIVALVRDTSKQSVTSLDSVLVHDRSHALYFCVSVGCAKIMDFLHMYE